MPTSTGACDAPLGQHPVPSPPHERLPRAEPPLFPSERLTRLAAVFARVRAPARREAPQCAPPLSSFRCPARPPRLRNAASPQSQLRTAERRQTRWANLEETSDRVLRLERPCRVQVVR